MKKNLIIVSTLLTIGVVIFFTPITGGLEAPKNNGFWYACIQKDDRHGCYRANFAFPRMTANEREFKRKLDSIPQPPARVSKSDLVTLFGREPDTTVELIAGQGRFGWVNYGPGDNQDRGIIIHLYKDQLSSIFWLQPGQFMLTRGHYPK